MNNYSGEKSVVNFLKKKKSKTLNEDEEKEEFTLVKTLDRWRCCKFKNIIRSVSICSLEQFSPFLSLVKISNIRT